MHCVPYPQARCPSYARKDTRGPSLAADAGQDRLQTRLDSYARAVLELHANGYQPPDLKLLVPHRQSTDQRDGSKRLEL